MVVLRDKSLAAARRREMNKAHPALSNGAGNGACNGLRGASEPSRAAGHEGGDRTAAAADGYDFGGSLGVLCIIVGSHITLYYLWFCLFHNEARVAAPAGVGGAEAFAKELCAKVAEAASPTVFAARFYAAFLLSQLVLAAVVPGITCKGLPLEYDPSCKLDYLLNGVACWYITLAGMAATQIFGWFDWSLLYDHFGEVMTVAVLCSDAVATGLYCVAKLAGTTYRMTGSHLQDFFFGAVLHPRLGRVDLKMFSEGRTSWVLLFMLSFSAAAKQWQLLGRVTPEVSLMLLAHFLYANAVMKGEECIPTTFDIFHEKWGWMLIFWNCAGVPFLYSLNTMYLVHNQPRVSNPGWHNVACLALLLAAYFVWDVSNSQKNKFRMQLNASHVERRAFPQLPWSTLRNPKYLDTDCGSKLLVDGFWRYARKIHYTCDAGMALAWGLVCGFDSLIPYFYPAFFAVMIWHRNRRDTARCKRKYKGDWLRYCEKVPYVFVPYVW